MHPQSLTYLRGTKARIARQEKRYVVRVFHPRGQYPRGSLSLPEALYFADDEIAFCVTHTMRWVPGDVEAPYTEMDWVTPDELRLISSVLLCEMESEGRILFYPVHHYSPIVNRQKLDLTRPDTIQALKLLVLDGLRKPEFGYNSETLNQCLRWRYSLIDEAQADLTRQADYWRRINPADLLLLRGLSALIKADMLSRYSEFFEEATICCFISLEASFRLILKRLASGGVRDPGSKDAAHWLHEHFDSHTGHAAPLGRYFEEFYDQRVMTLHPSSRFGDFAYAPLAHDDYYHLRGSLRSIFGYLVSGKHDRGFLEEVERLRDSRWV